MPSGLRNLNFACVLEALIDYADEGGGYSFVSMGDGAKLVIEVTVDDPRAYNENLVAGMQLMMMGIDQCDDERGAALVS